LFGIVLVIYLPRSRIIQNVSDIQDIALGECSAYAEDNQPLYKLGALDTSLDCGVFCFERKKIKIRYIPIHGKCVRASGWSQHYKVVLWQQTAEGGLHFLWCFLPSARTTY